MKGQHSSFHSGERLYRQGGSCGAIGREVQLEGLTAANPWSCAAELRMWMEDHGG